MANSLYLSPLSCLVCKNNMVAMFPQNRTFSSCVGLSQPIKSVVSTQSCHNSKNETSARARRSANYQPSSWSRDVFNSLGNKYPEGEHKNEEIRKRLVEEVTGMIESKKLHVLEVMELIDDVQRMGLGYIFGDSIRRAQDRIIASMGIGGGTIHSNVQQSLYATALYFRLLRQNGYNVSSDVFKRVLDSSGNFEANLSTDVEGMLSLYEASQLAFQNESILDMAKVFTSMHLKELKLNKTRSINIIEKVNHSLDFPRHHRMHRLETRWYIEEFSKRKEANSMLLELAKLDFNMLQSTHQAELRDFSRWWHDLGLADKLSFARDRLMENFFWAVGIAYEPQFSKCRSGLAKLASLITVIDDIYDVYGSLDELELFTEAVKGWDIKAVRNLPDYMQLSFLALYNTVNVLAYDTLKEKGEVVIRYLTKAWTDLCIAFLQEAKCTHNKSIPSFQEYLDNGWVSASGALLLVHAYPLVSQTITEEALKCLEDYHDLLRWPSMIFRLCNDLSTSTAERERGESANAISCYMQETGCSEEVAANYVRNLIDETWKKLNEEIVSNSPFENSFVGVAFNLARIAQCHYQYGDGHGAPDVRARNNVMSVLIEPIQLSRIEKVGNFSKEITRVWNP